MAPKLCCGSLLLLLLSLTSPESARATLGGSSGSARALSDSDTNEDIYFGMPLSFAEWCSEYFCNLRLFAVIGGELMMVDSGSSTMAFCEPPNPEFVTDIQRVQVFDENNTARNLSQCTKYGSGGHGWYGETYTGTIESNGVKTAGGTFAIMNKSVGLVGNQCGPILEGSIGIENSTVRGIMGIGSDDKFMYSDEVVGESWTDMAIEMGRCLQFECECPLPIARGFQSSFLNFLNLYDIYQFAITWDGTLGRDNGRLLYNEDAESDITALFPKIPIEMDPTRSRRLWSTNVTGMRLNGVPLEMNNTQYFFDTGSGYISLPPDIYDRVNASNTDLVIDFVVPTIDNWIGGNETSFNVTVTRGLLDARVFRRAYSADSPHFFGLNVMRFLDNLLIHFNDTSQAYFKANLREHILDLPRDLPLVELAGSESNETQELDIVDEKTGELEVNTTNIISETINNITGGSGGTAAKPCGLATTLVFAAAASAAVACLF